MQTNIHRSPYVGPRPFERRHTGIFYGRDREAHDLLDFVSSNQVVLVYAQSGVGKTSLLNAGLIPLLEQEEFEIFPIARVRGLIPDHIPYANIGNPYVLNTLISWAAEDTNPSTLLNVSINQFLRERPHLKDPSDFELPRVAIFDQFEELFSFYPDRWQQREDFFRQLRDALEQDDLFRVIFVMREDFIAQVDPYADILPGRLRSRFRLEPMTPQAALAAVITPLEKTSRLYAPGTAETLVEELTKVRVETQDGTTQVVSGEFVEPVQLQVVCQNLWQHLPEDVKVIDQRQIEAFGDIDKALSKFYEDSLSITVRETGVEEQALRQWFDDALITPAGTRGTVYQGRDETGGIPNDAVEVLVRQHIIRAELRAGGRWYELTHDRFIEPIQKANAEWGSVREEEQRKLHERALRQRFQRQVLLSGVLGLFLIVAIVSTIIAFQQRSIAEEQAALASTAQNDALNQAATATVAQGQAIGEAANAVAQRETAVAIQATSDRNANVARSIAQASGALQLLANDQPEFAIALALEANQVTQPPSIAYQSLFDSVTLSRVRARLVAHEQSVNAVIYSPDGDFIISGSSDKTIIVWDVKNQREIRRLTAHNAAITQLDISPDGKHIISGGNDGEIIIWNFDTGSIEHRISYQGSSIRGLDFNSDGTVFVAADDHRIRFWNVETGSATGETVTDLGSIAQVKYGADDSRLLIAISQINQDDEALRNFVVDYDLSVRQNHYIYEGHTSYITALVVSPDRQMAASGDVDGNINIWDLQHGSKIRSIREFYQTVFALAFSPDGRFLFSSSWATPPLLWSIETGRIVKRFDGEVTGAFSVSFAPDGLTAASGSENADILLWDVQTEDIVHTFTKDKTWVLAVGFHPERPIFASGDINGRVILWDAESQVQLREITTHSNQVGVVKFSQDGRYLLTGSQNEVYLWNTNTWVIEQSFKPITGFFVSAAISPDMQHIAIGNDDGTITIWNIQSGQPSTTLDGHVDAVWDVEFSPDGTQLLSGGADGVVILWDWQKGQIIRSISGYFGRVNSVAFSPDGTMAAFGSADHIATLWNLPSGQIAFRLRGHSDFVTDVEFRRDGKFLLSSSEDNTLILWDVASGEPLARFEGHEEEISRVSWGPNGHTAVSVGRDGNIILWNISPLPESLFVWLEANRSVAELSCDQRVLYQTNLQCDENGLVPSRTPFPTLVPTITPTPSPTLDLTRVTLTPSPTNTATPSPQPQVISALELANVALSSGYQITSRDTIKIDLSGGNNSGIENIGGRYGDFAIGTTFEWGSESTDDECGFGFRIEASDSLYILTLSQDHLVRFSPLINGDWQDSSILRIPYINTGEGAANELVLVAVDDRFSIYLNGTYITQVGDTHLAEGGLGLLAITRPDGNETRCTFRNTWVWDFAYAAPVIASPTPLPTATFTPTPTAPSDIQTAVAPMGLGNGRLVEQKGQTTVSRPSDAPSSGISINQFSGTYSNFVLGATLTGYAGDSEDACGFVFRRQGNDLYTVMVDHTGRLWFRSLIGGHFNDRIFSDVTSWRSGANEYNNVVLIAQGDTFSVYLNNQYVAQFQDTQLAAGGVSLAVEYSQANTGASCDFENAWLWEITGDNVTPPSSPTPLPTATATVTPTAPSGIQTAVAPMGLGNGRLVEQEAQTTVSRPNDSTSSGISLDTFSGSYSNFVLGATLTGYTGASEDACGFGFRRESNNLYTMMVDHAGKLWFRSVVDGHFNDRIFADATSWRSGANDRNDLVIIAQGDTFSVYLNGQYVAQFKDTQLATGSVSLAIESFGAGSGASCDFSDAWLWEITGNNVTPPPSPTPLPTGEPQNANLGGNRGTVQRGSSQSWIYAGHAGDALVVTTEADWDTIIRIYNQSGELIGENDDAGTDIRTSRLEVALPDSGNYRIEVSSYNNQSGGSYVLTISQGSPDA